jgi:transposase
MDTSESGSTGRRRRRRHSAEFKAQVVAACRKPGVSIASVALDHRLNANLVRNWVVREERAGAPVPVLAADTARAEANAASPAFVPVELQRPATTTQEIVVELRRGATLVKITWPLAAAGSCGVWLREWLR